MVELRNGPKGAEFASFGLASLIFVLTPTQVGYQDLAALLAQQPSVAARWREHLIASPFGTIHAATFSLPRPVGTAIPENPTIRLASLGGSADIVGSIGINPHSARRENTQVVFPTINRTGKGDRLVPGTPEPLDEARAHRRSRDRTAAARDVLGSPEGSRNRPQRFRIARRAGRRAFRDRARGRAAQCASGAGGRDRGRDAFRAVPRIRHCALARIRSEDPDGRGRRSRRSRPDRIHPERAAEPRRPERRRERDAALFRQRPVRNDARRHQAVERGRRAGADDAAARLRRSGHEEGAACACDGAARRDHRRKGPGDGTGPASEEPGGAPQPVRREARRRRRNASRTRSISRRAANPCAGRSRSRRS